MAVSEIVNRRARPIEQPSHSLTSTRRDCRLFANVKDPVMWSRFPGVLACGFCRVADGLHVPTVHTKDELVLRRDYTHEPLPVGRKCDWQGGAEASGFRQDAHESNDVAARRLGSKRILRLQADEIATVAEHDV